MSDILLAKPTLPHGFIDLSVGEPHVVREGLFSVFDMKDWKLPTPDHCWEYPCTTGYRPLVDLLEHKHQAKVVITNGAKQALGATFYALKKMGRKNILMRSPYWALIPPLVEMHGLRNDIDDGTEAYLNRGIVEGADAFLCLSPNNPDGYTYHGRALQSVADFYKDLNVPFIHDAAYYTHSYISREHELLKVGDVQIYSISKMLGLSNLRVGYAVCHNLEYYKLIRQYVEATTVGVSLPSQMFAYDILNQMRGYPTLTEKFENISFSALQQSKKIMRKVSPEILEVPDNVEDIPGMFLWAKKGNKCDFAKAKINAIDGAHFGAPEYIRMNLAFNKNIMLEIVSRLNGSLI